MSEQNPKPPNPNESFKPPMVVNPAISRLDKSLKTKKTTHTMNPKPVNTMKHIDMLSKSSDVNFKKVMTRSGSKLGELAEGNDDMEVGDGNGENMEGNEGMVNGDSLAEEGGNTMSQGNVAQKGIGGREGVCDNEDNCNVSVMFPELSNDTLGKKSIDNSCVDGNVSEIPVSVEQNPVLNPVFKNEEGVRVSDVANGGNKGDGLGKKNDTNEGNAGSQGKVEIKNVGSVGSGSKDVEMQDKYKPRKLMLFSNVVKGANYSGSNKLKWIPCAMNEGRSVVELDPVIEKGNKKWELTVVGYFVGMKMSYRDIVGHLKRMWRLYQLEEIIVHESGLYFF